jgi:hypothetical protein
VEGIENHILTLMSLIAKNEIRVWCGLAEPVFGQNLEPAFVRNVAPVAIKMF